MVLLSGHNLRKVFGSRTLFENLSVGLSAGDRLGVIGPNGSGKSTLMELLAGCQEPDGGNVSLRKLTRLGYVPQDSVFPPGDTVATVLRRSLLATAEGRALDELEVEARLNLALGKADFRDAHQLAGSLSGGWRKRLAIAAELIKDPDVLLLDEPTNHLDLEGIWWLEQLLSTASFASMVISHDRYFLENTAHQMVEINRTYPDGLFYVDGGYSMFLEKKEQFLHAQAQQQEALETLVRREIEWLRRGPKARTTKSKARIQAAGRLMEDLADLNARTQKAAAQIDFTASDRKTKKLIALEKVAKSMGGRRLFGGLNLSLSPGVRLGLVGANGSGKTTLLKILKGDLQPDEGRVERAEFLKVVHFDQYREQIDPSLPLKKALSPEGDSVIYQGRTIHVNGWAKRFLFREDQLMQPVSSLSGGERARVQIARLMLQEADLLLLDEPTNDLDIPTLEILEESLLEYPGALVLVTHDRFMLDRVSTVVLGLDGDGAATVFADYSQWEAALNEKESNEKEVRKEEKPAAVKDVTTGKKKLSYKDQREWEGMEERILEAEARLESCHAEVQSASASGDGPRIQAAFAAQQSAQEEVDRLYARWAELEAKVAG